MKQKTAMMELIEKINKLIQNDFMHKYIEKDFFLIRHTAKQLLEKEKEQIMRAYNEGLFDGSVSDINNIPFNDYYKQTYLNDSNETI